MKRRKEGSQIGKELTRTSSDVTSVGPEDLFSPQLNNIKLGKINFIGLGKHPSSYTIVPKSYPVGQFAEEFFLDKCKLEKPKVLLSVTGGAQDFKMLTSKLEQVFSRGLLRAAQSTTAWIVTGGLDSGVMEFVGDAIRGQDARVPCIGIATFSKVVHYEDLDKALDENLMLKYSPDKANDDASASLNPDHSHFVLVKSPDNKWGEEIQFRSDLEDFITREWQVPLVLIAINGGPGTIATVLEGVRKGFPTILVDGSGRACDAISSFLKHREDNKYSDEVWEAFVAPMKPDQRKRYEEQMEELVKRKQFITIFNPNEDATIDMDQQIFRSILQYNSGATFAQKMALGVQWGKPELITELMEADSLGAQQRTKDQKMYALNRALQKSLQLDKPEIYELLVQKGAEINKLNLSKLYNKDMKYQIERLKPFAMGSFIDIHHHNEFSPRLRRSAGVDQPENLIESAKNILHYISPTYERLLSDNITTSTDLLIWAILAEKHELAKSIWRYSEMTIHSALVACHIFSVLYNWFQGEQVYETNRAWFEEAAISVIAEMDYEDAKAALELKWAELKDINALELAEHAECKDFFSHPYLQRYLDERLYSDEYGRIPPGTRVWHLVLCCIFPFLIPISGFYEYIIPKKSRYYHFYNLPVVKFLTSTMCYVGFLFLLTLNVARGGGDDEIRVFEWAMWFWLFALIWEEVQQFLEEGEKYFELISNQMDVAMYFLLSCYLILRVASLWIPSEFLKDIYTDVLIVATIACFLRLLNVFAFSKHLGPLFFVIIRLFWDVWQWLLIFSLFMISFQLGIFALARRAGDDPWERYPNGTLGVGFSTIIGDMGNSMDILSKTNIGVGLLSLYALIAQIMLVNLLIAMMGDTYSSVKENSDKEWKFYRYGLLTDYVSSSPVPPPLNLFFDSLLGIKQRVLHHDYMRMSSTLLEIQKKARENRDNVTTRMRLAKERMLDKERAESYNSLSFISHTVREHMRLMTTYQDNNKLYVEYNLKNIHAAIQTLQAQVDELAALQQGSSSASPRETTTTLQRRSSRIVR